MRYNVEPSTKNTLRFKTIDQKLTLDVGWILRFDLRCSTTSGIDLPGLPLLSLLSTSTLDNFPVGGAGFPLFPLTDLAFDVDIFFK